MIPRDSRQTDLQNGCLGHSLLPRYKYHAAHLIRNARRAPSWHVQGRICSVPVCVFCVCVYIFTYIYTYVRYIYTSHITHHTSHITHHTHYTYIASNTTTCTHEFSQCQVHYWWDLAIGGGRSIPDLDPGPSFGTWHLRPPLLCSIALLVDLLFAFGVWSGSGLVWFDINPNNTITHGYWSGT